MAYETRRFNPTYTMALQITPIVIQINPIHNTDEYFS